MSDTDRTTVAAPAPAPTRSLPPLVFVLAVLAQMAVIGAIAWSAHGDAVTGTGIYARIEPVDPRDPLRGDYLTYRFEDLSSLNLFEASGLRVGDTVYVPVEREEDHWDFVGGSVYRKVPDRLGEPETPGDEDIIPEGPYLKGVVTSIDHTNGTYEEGTTIEVSYGAEQYFVEEGTGTRFPSGDAMARLSVGDDGKVMVREILVDRKPWP